MGDDVSIARQPGPSCPVCGASGGFRQFPIEGNFSLVRCRCGLRRLWPQPSEKELDEFYGAGYYSYARRRGARKQIVWNLLRDAASDAPLHPLLAPARPTLTTLARYQFDVIVPVTGTSVLDVGCGHGDLLMYQRSRGSTVVGIERGGFAAASGRQEGLEVHEDLERAGLPPATFSDVVMQHSLEHLASPSSVLSEIRRVIRPDGRLHVALPNGDAAGLRCQRIEWFHLSFPGHFWFFNAEGLEMILAAHGLSWTGFRGDWVR